MSGQVTYEIQPPSYTALKLLSGPPRGGGGDTLWSSQYAVYDLLSPGMQRYLEGLEALHSAQIQADGSKALGRTVRREPVVTKHPLIRTVSILALLPLSFLKNTRLQQSPLSENPSYITTALNYAHTC